MPGRIKVKIDKSQLIAAINEEELSATPPSNRSELYKRVAAKLGKPPGAVLGRINDYKINLQTPIGKKGKAKGAGIIPIDKDELIAAINEVETGDTPPSNRSELYKRVGEMLGKTTGAVIGRINDYEIQLRTPKGERGGHLKGGRVVASYQETPLGSPYIVVSVKDKQVTLSPIYFNEYKANEVFYEMDEENPGGVSVHKLTFAKN